MDWKKLQNGSDIRGVALEGIEGENVNLTPQVTHIIAKAFLAWLSARCPAAPLTVAVGIDSRLSGPMLKDAFMAGAAQAGAQVLDFGMASTPAMFMATVDEDLKVDGAVMITASHLPFNRNGLKFFTAQGGLDKPDIKEILELAAGMEESITPATPKACNVKSLDFMNQYSRNLVDFIRQGGDETPLKGMKIVVDAGNGAGGFFVDKVLAPLGADTTGSQFLTPDGRFPNHVPNPENKEAMASIGQAVVDHHAHLGIIFDTDVDRSAIVDKSGQPINRNALIALISTVILREHPGSAIVTDSVTSDGLTEFIAGLGGVHHRFRRGYKNVINEGIRLNHEGQPCWLAIETSGHAALRENHFLDDGAYLVAKLLIEAARLNAQGQGLQDLIKTLKQPCESKEIRFSIQIADFKTYGQQVLDHLAASAASQPGWNIVSPNYEGVRVACEAQDEQGWFLLRQSLHDPVLPLNIESNVAGGVARVEERIMRLLGKFDKLVRR